MHIVSSDPLTIWLRIILYFVSSWVVNFLPAFPRSFSPPDFSPFAAKLSCSSFSPLYHPSSLFYQSSTLVAGQLHGRSYRSAMTRKWNVLSRARHSSLPPYLAAHRGRPRRSPSPDIVLEVFSALTRHIRGIFTLAANRE